MGLIFRPKKKPLKFGAFQKLTIYGEELSLDLLLVTPQVRDVWETREQVDFLGKVFSVVSRKGLIKMKTLAGRPQDLAELRDCKMEKIDVSAASASAAVENC